LKNSFPLALPVSLCGKLRKVDNMDRRIFMKVAATALAGTVGLIRRGKAPSEESPDSIKRFSIKIPQTALDDLHDRLVRTRFPDQLDGAGWDYGTELSYLKELVAYWQSGFDWRAQERKFNRFDHFQTSIDGLKIHFVHQRSKEKNAIPLIITHGWPGSFVEFTKIIGPLTDPAAYGGRSEDAFHVICPSIPGYGFSEAPKKPGFGGKQVAHIFAKLMARLGYSRYSAQGGDWGVLISTWLAAIDVYGNGKGSPIAVIRHLHWVPVACDSPFTLCAVNPCRMSNFGLKLTNRKN
jgi:hypothetical protein